MNRRNYQRELDRIIEKNGETRPRVLLHVCCGPCSSSVLEYLTQYFDLTLLWYNPNIYPEAEFDLRLETLKKLIRDMGLADRVTLLTEEHRAAEYYARVKGLEDEPEGRRRRRPRKRAALTTSAQRSPSLGTRTPCASTRWPRRSPRARA